MSQQRDTGVRANPATRCTPRALGFALDIEAVELGQPLPGLIVLQGRQRSDTHTVVEGAAKAGPALGKPALNAPKSLVDKRAGTRS